MKICVKCGQSIPNDSAFCSFCGESCYMPPNASVNSDSTQGAYAEFNRQEEQRQLDSLYKRLKWERIAWLVPGILSLVSSIMILLVAIAFAAVAIFTGVQYSSDDMYYYDNNNDGYYDEYYDEYYYYDEFGNEVYDSGELVVGGVGVVFGIVYFILGLVSLALSIVALVMASKVRKYRDKLYTDCTDAIKHSTSVGVLIFALFFSIFPLVAVIINYIQTENNMATLQRAKETQRAYNAQFVVNR